MKEKSFKAKKKEWSSRLGVYMSVKINGVLDHLPVKIMNLPEESATILDIVN